MKPALLITLEGIEGVGKTTQLEFITDYLQQAGRDFIVTREPGGTQLGEAIRALVLDNQHVGMSAEAELLLMFAARAEHLDKVIKPALTSGTTVLCDRFTDASYAYQGLGRNIPRERIDQLKYWLLGDLQPDLTLLLDAPVEVGLARAAKRSAKDRFESEDMAFFQAVRQCYLDMADQEPGRVKLIDATQNLEQVQQQVQVVLKEQLS